MKQNTILIPVNQGFAIRYLLQTDIFVELQRAGNRIVILVPNPLESSLTPFKQFDNVIFETYRETACYDFLQQSKIEKQLALIRLFTLNAQADITTIKGIHNAWTKDFLRKPSIKKKLTVKIVNFIVYLTRRIRLLRDFLLWIEQRLFSPALHRDIFESYKPNLLIVSSLGTFDYDQFFMREAYNNKVPVMSILLSWDNTTTRGMPGAYVNHVVAWTDIMQQELIELHDIPKRDIFVGGVAHFDHYYKDKVLLDRHKLFAKLHLDTNKKTIFFITKSPNCYPWNADIAEIILRAMRQAKITASCQLITRLHPIYYRKKNNTYVFQSFLDQFMQLQQKYPELVINEPEIISKTINYLMPEDEISILASILKHCDLAINIFSTVNVEACVFNKPIINICFEGTAYPGPEKARYEISMDEAQTHNQRIVKSGAIKMARNDKQLVELINEALAKPTADATNRQHIVQTECGPFQGNAGEKIAQHITRLLHNNKDNC